MKLIVVTPAGRENYLRLLGHYVLGSPEVDEWQIWDNCLKITACKGRVVKLMGGGLTGLERHSDCWRRRGAVDGGWHDGARALEWRHGAILRTGRRSAL